MLVVVKLLVAQVITLLLSGLGWLLYHAARAVLVGGGRLLCLRVGAAGLSGQVVGDMWIMVASPHLLMAGLFAGGAGGQTGRIGLATIVGLLLVLLGVKVSGQLRLVLLLLATTVVVSGRAMHRA